MGATRVIEPESPILLLINEIPSITQRIHVEFQGLATPGTILTIKRNYVDYSTMQLPAAGDGSFSTEVRLTPEGENVISLKCFNVKTALSTQITATVIRDVSPPYITIDPSTKRNTNEPSALIVGATSEPVSEVTVNGEQAELTLDQTAFIINVRLNEGVNLFNIQAIDFAGNAGSYELLITKDMGMPVPKDIAGHWAEAGIMELIYKGIVSGYDDNTFRPDAAITRAEFCCLIVKAYHWSPTSPMCQISLTLLIFRVGLFHTLALLTKTAL